MIVNILKIFSGIVLVALFILSFALVYWVKRASNYSSWYTAWLVTTNIIVDRKQYINLSETFILTTNNEVSFRGEFKADLTVPYTVNISREKDKGKQKWEDIAGTDFSIKISQLKKRQEPLTIFYKKIQIKEKGITELSNYLNPEHIEVPAQCFIISTIYYCKISTNVELKRNKNYQIEIINNSKNVDIKQHEYTVEIYANFGYN